MCGYFYLNFVFNFKKYRKRRVNAEEMCSHFVCLRVGTSENCVLTRELEFAVLEVEMWVCFKALRLRQLRGLGHTAWLASWQMGYGMLTQVILFRSFVSIFQ